MKLFKKTKSSIAIFIDPDNFNDEEYLFVMNTLEESGAEITTISTKVGVCKGRDGSMAFSDATFNDIDYRDYDAIVFIGGEIYKGEIRSSISNLSNNALRSGKIIGAISVSPLELFHGELLEGRKISVEKIGENENIIIKKKIILSPKNITVDKNLITAKDPKDSTSFAKSIIKAIKEKK